MVHGRVADQHKSHLLQATEPMVRSVIEQAVGIFVLVQRQVPFVATAGSADAVLITFDSLYEWRMIPAIRFVCAAHCPNFVAPVTKCITCHLTVQLTTLRWFEH